MKNSRSMVALALLVPAPTVGVIAGMIVLPDHFAGKLIFSASKVWLLVLPAVWRLVVEKEPVSLSRPAKGGFIVSAWLGVALTAFVVVAYVAFGRTLIDAERIREMASNTGLADPRVYLGGAVYWILVNSLIEEYVWRWFVVEKFEDVMPTRWAIVASAFAFTIHHIVAMQVYFSWLVTGVGAMGIFVAGVVWSWCYVRYRSIWPVYLSHAIVDIAVFAIGYSVIFG
jgi:hypothetical protein